MTALHELAGLGQSIWIDYIGRAFITSGEMQKLIEAGITGMTSNPAIFEQAIAGSDDYDQELQQLAKGEWSTMEIYENLAIDDVQRAADLLRPVFESIKTESPGPGAMSTTWSSHSHLWEA